MTYAGHPLYTYAGDTQPGQTTAPTPAQPGAAPQPPGQAAPAAFAVVGGNAWITYSVPPGIRVGVGT